MSAQQLSDICESLIPVSHNLSKFVPAFYDAMLPVNGGKGKKTANDNAKSNQKPTTIIKEPVVLRGSIPVL